MRSQNGLVAILAGVGIAFAQPTSRLEAHTAQGAAQFQPADQQISDVWGNKFYFRGISDSSLSVSQQIPVSDQNYTAEIVYTGRKGSNGSLTEWNATGLLYKKTDMSKPVYSFDAKGSVGNDGKFVLGDTTIGVSGTLPEYEMLMPNYSRNILTIIQVGDKAQVSAWVSSMTQNYNRLAKSR